MPVTKPSAGRSRRPSRRRRERHHRAAGVEGAVEHGQRVGAHDAPADVAVAVAGAGLAGGDVAHHRAGVAADLLRRGHREPAAGAPSRANLHFVQVPPAGVLGPREERARGRRAGSAGHAPALRGADRREHPVGQGGEAGDLGAGGVADGVEDRGRGRDQHVLAEALGAERALGVGLLDQDRHDLGHVADGRDQVVVQVLGAAGQVFLHQRHADALGDAALDLALGQRRVDRPADVVGGGDPVRSAPCRARGRPRARRAARRSRRRRRARPGRRRRAGWSAGRRSPRAAKT